MQKNSLTAAFHISVPPELQTTSENVSDIPTSPDTDTLQPYLTEDYEEEERDYDDNDYEDPEYDEDTVIINIFKTCNEYNIIYAAPTWEDEQFVDELLKLPVQRVISNDCALLLWVKSPLIHQALKIIDKWGFTYNTVVFVGVNRTKDDEGKLQIFCDKTSDWTLEVCEFCLLATKGTVRRVKDNIPQLVANVIKDESKKSEDFKELTVQLLGDLLALELFPDLEALENEDNFSTAYNKIIVRWDMAAPKWYFEELAEEERLERNREALGL